MSASEVITGIAGGVGTAAVLYAVRLMRRMVSKATEKIEEIVAAPAEVKELRAAVSTNTDAIAHLSSVSANLSSALEKLATIAERAASGGSA